MFLVCLIEGRGTCGPEAVVGGAVLLVLRGGGGRRRALPRGAVASPPIRSRRRRGAVLRRCHIKYAITIHHISLMLFGIRIQR